MCVSVHVCVDMVQVVTTMDLFSLFSLTRENSFVEDNSRLLMKLSKMEKRCAVALVA